MLTYDQLVDEDARLRGVVAAQERQLLEQQVQLAQLQARIGQLETLVEQQAAVIKLQAAEVERLKRRDKRQAAPFSKGSPKFEPKKPGRRKGRDYGKRAERAAPEQVDQTIQVQCPLYCPHCSSQVRLEGKASQFQVDLPTIRPQATEFVIQWGRYTRCGRRVQGRHPEQVSDALSVGNVHLGPGVIGLSSHLNKICGLWFGKIASWLASGMGLLVHRSSLCRASERLARKAKPTRAALVEKVLGSPVVTANETGWRIGGLGAWLWGFATQHEPVYQIERGRAFVEASKILGADFSGVLIVDGWAPYRRFEAATLQTWLNHLLRRCSELLEHATRGAVRSPRAVRALLKQSQGIRDRRDAGSMTPHGVRFAGGQLQAKMHRLLDGDITNVENGRLAKHFRVIAMPCSCFSPPMASMRPTGEASARCARRS